MMATPAGKRLILLLFFLGLSIGWIMSETKMFSMSVHMSVFQYTEDNRNMNAPIVDRDIAGMPTSPSYQLCPHQSDKSCLIRKDNLCPFRSYFHTMLFVSGTISTINSSNMDIDQLSNFCRGDTQHHSFKKLNVTRLDVICRRSIESSILQLSTSGREPLVLLPGWGFHWPGDDDKSRHWWPFYSTGILVKDTVCFWPYIPNLNETENDLSLWTRGNNSTGKVDHSPVHFRKAMISQGFFDNIWHASAIMNTWCKMRDEEDLHFVVQSMHGILPENIYRWGALLGISSERIIPQGKRPIIVDEILLSASYRDVYVDWSCLHGILRLSPNPEAERFAMLYTRTNADPSRDIPFDIIYDLEKELGKHLPDLKVKRFVGTEPLAELQGLFANAKIVIGPHGAGFVNLVFCQERTPVVEFVVPHLLDRPWQMYGGHSFQLPWWPVLLDSFDSKSQILDAVAVVAEALKMA